MLPNISRVEIAVYYALFYPNSSVYRLGKKSQKENKCYSNGSIPYRRHFNDSIVFTMWRLVVRHPWFLSPQEVSPQTTS